MKTTDQILLTLIFSGFFLIALTPPHAFAAPSVTSFSAFTTSNSWNIPITLFTASDPGGSVAGYCVTPVNSSAGCTWSASAPASYAVTVDGTYTLYPWARDGVGNVSAVYPAPVNVTVDTHTALVTPWLQKTKLMMQDSDLTYNDAFGIPSLSVDGNTALISTFHYNSDQGVAFVFVRSVSGWAQQAKLQGSDVTYSDRFGLASQISADSNTAIVGAYQKNSGQGAAYVFTRSGTTWSQQAKLTALDGAANDYFGYSVTISSDGNTAIIGAHGKSSAQGAAYVFTRSGTTWSQRTKLTASDAAANNYFGYSVSLSGAGDIALIGASGRSASQGAAYVFTGSGATWTQRSTLTASPPVAGENFGYPVVLSSDGGTALIGTYNVGNAVYLFTGSGASWTQQARLTGSNTVTGDGFGVSVALDSDGNTALVGAYAKNSAQGAAYIFRRSAATWTEVAKPMGSDVVVGDWFGRFVALSGDGSTALIAAFNKPYSYYGAAGAVYTFSPPTVATVATTAVTAITATTASSGGNVSVDGGIAVTARGVCWSTAINPTLTDSCTSNGSGTGAFTSSITGLTQGTDYHVRAYATNLVGTAYGNDVIIDHTLPSVTSFSAFTTSNSWNIPITLFTASDPGGSVAGYCVTPVNSSAGCTWSASAPASYAVTVDGTYTLYPWARDGVGNVSAVYPAPVNVTVDTHTALVTPWLQKTKLMMQDSDLTYNDAFGIPSLSVDGNTALISTFHYNSDQGVAFVFVRSVSGWAQQAKLQGSDVTYSDRFGLASQISADSNTAIVGAYQKNSGQGAAYVFTRSGTTWSQQAKLTALDGAANDYFGYSVTISSDGNTAIIGAHGKSSAQGAAYVFTRSGTTWSQRTKLTASDAAANNYFGYSVSLSGAGDIALIGASGRSASQGAAYVFTGSGATWTQRSTLTASPPVAGENFGYPVVLSSDGGTALIGTYNVGNAVYLFTGSGASWTQQARLTGSNTVTGDGFGVSVALDSDGNTALVGAYAKNSAQGAAYIFRRSAATWTEVAKPMGSDVVVGDWFGRFVALSGDGSTALIAAFNKPYSYYGAAGAVYTFSPPTVATVATTAVTAITATTASSGGNVSVDGGIAVTARGVCWSTAINPTLTDSCTSNGSGTGAFTSSITGLTQGTDYHVRAYATNLVGTAYGNEMIFYTDFPVSVTLQGDGVGVVHSSAPDINCSSGPCTQTYPYNSIVTLSPAAGYHSLFGGWQGSCFSSSGDCVLTMDVVRAVLATFIIDPDYAVWIDPGTNYFDTIGAAYETAGAFAMIKACRLEITENLDFSLGKSIVISGGYDSNYSNISGRTTVKGTFKVRSGNVRVRNVAVR